jgi:hypothetical protein
MREGNKGSTMTSLHLYMYYIYDWTGNILASFDQGFCHGYRSSLVDLRSMSGTTGGLAPTSQVQILKI